jgi:hypothetical protein
MGKNQDLGLSLGWKIRARLGCFQWRRLLVYQAIRKAKEGATILLYRGKVGAVGFGRGGAQERRRKGGAHAFRVCPPC